MSNLIKIKQIEGGNALKKLANDNASEIAALKRAVGEGSVADQVAALETTHYEGTKAAEQTVEAAIAAIVGDAELRDGDTCVLKEQIHGDKYSYTAYIRESNAWKAMDGNYNASNVYFDEDLTYTAAIGVKTVPSTGSGTITAAGKTLEEVMKSILAEEKNPETTDPTLTVSSSNIGSKEVGTKIKVQYSLAYNDGSYTYGPEPTGATVVDGTWKATFNGETINAQSGTFAEVQVADGMSLSISGEVEHTAGSNPVTNIGSEYAAGAIEGGKKTGSKGTLTGYRKPFWGYKLTADALADPTAITSAQVRALQKSGSSQAGLPTSYTIPADTKQVYFLAKAGTKNSISVKNTSSLNAPVAFVKVASGVQVEGENNYTATAYDLWYANFDNATTGEAVYSITWG